MSRALVTSLIALTLVACGHGESSPPTERSPKARANDRPIEREMERRNAPRPEAHGPMAAGQHPSKQAFNKRLTRCLAAALLQGSCGPSRALKQGLMNQCRKGRHTPHEETARPCREHLRPWRAGKEGTLLQCLLSLT